MAKIAVICLIPVALWLDATAAAFATIRPEPDDPIAGYIGLGGFLLGLLLSALLLLRWFSR